MYNFKFDGKIYSAILPPAPALNDKFISRNYCVSHEFRRFKLDVDKLWMAVRDILPIPKLYLKKGNREFERNATILIHVFDRDNRRDVDATEKVVQDVLQGKFYDDDKQIWDKKTCIWVDKRNPRIEVFVTEAIRNLLA